jgi:hypothetical protein
MLQATQQGRTLRRFRAECHPIMALAHIIKDVTVVNMGAWK